MSALPATAYQLAVTRPGSGPAVRLTVTVDHLTDGSLARLLDRYPALRTGIDVRAAPLQLLRAASGSRVRVDSAPDGRSTVTIELDDATIDPVSAAALARELAGEPDPSGPPRYRMREALTAGADGQAPVRDRWRALAEWSAAGPPAATTTTNASTSAESAVAADVAQGLTAVAAALGTTAEIVAFTAYLWFVGRLRGDVDSGSLLVTDGRAATGLTASDVGEFRALVPVVVRRDPRSREELVERVARWVSGSSAGLRHPVGAFVPDRAPVFEYRATPMPPGSTYDDDPPWHHVVTMSAGSGGVLRAGCRWATGGAGAVLAGYLDVLAEFVSDPHGDLRPHTVRRAADPGPPPDPVPTRVFALAERHPDAVAVVDGDRQLTYAGFCSRVATVATHLRAAGVGTGSVVGVHLPRSADLIVTVVGVLTAGAAFLALDVDYPRQRSVDALADAGVDLLVASAAHAADLGFAGTVLEPADLVADGPGAAWTPGSGPAPVQPPASGAAPAYVLFTSGSTGRPKGVVLTHDGLAALCRWTGEQLGLRATDRVAQRTPVAFDAGVWELVAPLACGAAIVVLDSSVSREPARLEAALTASSVTVLQMVPSLLAVHVAAGVPGRCPSLRMILSGGEPLPRALADAIAAQSTAALVNVYGPTECTVDATWWVAGPHDGGGTVPIGRAVPALSAVVLDALGDPVPVGGSGELYLGGVQLATGYLGRPAQTADRFRPDPDAAGPGARRYRTGDRVRLGRDGIMEYQGRTDRQIKVRGVRIEPGEVEAAVARVPGVRQAAVRGYPSGGDTALAAYVTGTTDVTSVRARLRDLLPDQMLPTVVVALPELPLLPNGKVDHGRLPVPGPPRPGYRPPRPGIEELLARELAAALAVDAVGRLDDLAALGMNRSVALRVAATVARAGHAVDPARMLGTPTLAGLAGTVWPVDPSTDDPRKDHA